MRPATIDENLHELFDTRDRLLWAEELEKVDSAEIRSCLAYAGSLLGALPAGDFLEIEETLEDGLLQLEQARQLALPVRRFFEVSLLQGLAFLRILQGRRREALFIYLVMADALDRRPDGSAPWSRLLDRAGRLATILGPGLGPGHSAASLAA